MMPNAAHFHVVARKFRAGADDLAAIHEGDFCDVIGNEAVTTLDQGQDSSRSCRCRSRRE